MPPSRAEAMLIIARCYKATHSAARCSGAAAAAAVRSPGCSPVYRWDFPTLAPAKGERKLLPDPIPTDPDPHHSQPNVLVSARYTVGAETVPKHGIPLLSPPLIPFRLREGKIIGWRDKDGESFLVQRREGKKSFIHLTENASGCSHFKQRFLS